jgi:hypothetical protein
MAKKSVKTHKLSALRMPGFNAEASLIRGDIIEWQRVQMRAPRVTRFCRKVFSASEPATRPNVICAMISMVGATRLVDMEQGTCSSDLNDPSRNLGEHRQCGWRGLGGAPQSRRNACEAPPGAAARIAAGESFMAAAHRRVPSPGPITAPACRRTTAINGVVRFIRALPRF